MCLSDITFFINEMISLETFFSMSCKDSSISDKISTRTLNCVSVSPDKTSLTPAIKVYPWSVTTSYVPLCLPNFEVPSVCKVLHEPS